MADSPMNIHELYLEPGDFDSKLSELRNIAERMRSYNHKTPSRTVIADHKAALKIYQQLKHTIENLKVDKSLDALVRDLNRDLGKR